MGIISAVYHGCRCIVGGLGRKERVPDDRFCRRDVKYIGLVNNDGNEACNNRNEQYYLTLFARLVILASSAMTGLAHLPHHTRLGWVVRDFRMLLWMVLLVVCSSAKDSKHSDLQLIASTYINVGTWLDIGRSRTKFLVSEPSLSPNTNPTCHNLSTVYND